MSSRQSILRRAERLRAAVASLGHAMEKLAGDLTRNDTATAPVLGSCEELVDVLDLELPPDLRLCPACGHAAIRDATHCAFCWIELAPLAEGAPEVVPAYSS